MTLSAVTLLINGLTLSLSLGFLIIILWYNSSLFVNQAFGYFLVAVLLWNVGSFLYEFTSLSGDFAELSEIANVILEIGFVVSSILLYLLSTALVGLQFRYIRLITLSSVFIIVAYRILIVSVSNFQLSDGFHPMFVAFYLFFDFFSAFIVWRYRRKLKSRLVIIGICVFALGQTLLFVQAGSALSLATIVACLGILTLSFGIIKQEIITPLSKRDTQIDSIYQIGLAISRLLSLRTVLDSIADQVAEWLEADAVCICLRRGSEPVLVVMIAHNLPQQYVDNEIPFGVGALGTCAEKGETIFLEDYSRDWNAVKDFPESHHNAFGSVICVPLRYGDEVIGVLQVISGRHGRLFDADDVHSLELLSSQVAIAISHSQLFEEQKQLNRMRSELVRMASHDLKNPLMGALMHVDLLRDYDVIIQDDRTTMSVDVIEAQLNRMSRIIRGILDIEMLSASGILDEKCSPYDVIHNALVELKYFIEDRNVEVKVETEDNLPDFKASVKQFERALINLIENAVKFTVVTGGVVTIKAYLDDKNIVFSVSDEGVGIPKSLGNEIFERFYRGGQKGVEHVTGTGLGLSIVKSIAENHKGRTYFDSVEGQGSTFYIVVPYI
jgi:signal transduction histidine kinase